MIQTSSQGAVRVFSVTGALNLEEAEHLREAIEAEPLVGRPQWVLDLAETPLIDSAGCEVLLDSRDRARSVGGAVHLVGVTPLCADILEATGVAQSFAAFDSISQAVAQYAR